MLLGVAVGTAVLTGALLVGDSLRGSLRDLACASSAGSIRRYWSPAVSSAKALADELHSARASGHVVPVILLKATAAASEGDNAAS